MCLLFDEEVLGSLNVGNVGGTQLSDNEMNLAASSHDCCLYPICQVLP